MKPSLRTGNTICRKFRILLLLLLPVFSYSQTFVGATGIPADNSATVGATVTIAGASTTPGAAAAGDLVVIYAQYRASGGTLTITTTAGQAWTSETANSGGNQTTRIFWCRFNGTWTGGNIVISGGNGTNPFNAAMYVFRPSHNNNLWGINVAQVNANPGTVTTASIPAVTTTASKTVTMGFWASEDRNTWGTLTGTGWSKASFPANQYRINATADMSNTAAYNIQTSAVTTTAVSQSQTANGPDATLTSRITWYEINDVCAGAELLTSTAVCTNVTGSLVNATATAGVPGSCGNVTSGDVWYRFVAQTTNPVINLSNIGASLLAASYRLQLLSGACPGVSSLACVNATSISATGLTIGATYYIRISTNTAGVPTGTYAAWDFDICIVDTYPAPANDLCSAASTISSNPTCSNTAGTLLGATSTASVPGTCGNATSADVWYSFVAQSTNPTITLSSVGANFAAATPRIQILTGPCGSWGSSLFCSGSPLAASGLTIGATYFVRITSNTATGLTSGAWGFNICITDPAPVNDNCAADIVLTSANSCASPVPGNVYPATTSAVTLGTPNCSGTVFNDVWYSFVAQTINPLITLNLAPGFTTPGIQLLSDNCGGTFTVLFCSTGTNTLQADYLVLGTTYFVRVFSTAAVAASAGFTICVVDPTAPVPPNDESVNAINLLTNPSCSNVPGTVSGATISATPVLVTCTGPVAYDVWYKFTAISTTSTITLSSVGSNFNTPRMQLLTAGLVHIACGTTSIANATVAGTTYYVRVYSATGPAPNGNADFNICVAGTGTGGQVRHGNSYVNVTRKSTGGVVQNGDILEIRMTINHTVTTGTFRYLRFVDNLPTNTEIADTAPNDSIRVITNEGLTYKKYQINAASDAASYLLAPPVGQYQIRLNLGFGGSLPGIPPDNSSTNVTTTTGTMAAGSNKPRGGGGMLFAIAYRVRVTGVAGQKIVMNAPQFIYDNGTADVTLTGTPFEILISDPLTLCANSIGVSIASESGGTFGTGTALNRSTDLNFPITGYSFVSNMNANNTVGDGRYAIVKNMSPRTRTITTARRENACGTGININDPLNCNNRMYGHWDIDGDHTGTATSAGNAPPDASTSGGYMLMVNADYVASEIYKQTIPILCPNTYYEFSAWVRNICPTCGIDSSGTSQYLPGVLPNLTFALNGVDFYNTGEIGITGWEKKGFVFKTDTNQTSAIFSIRNNSQGGGGNDWVLDDIAVATCFPNMTYSPSAVPNVCEGNVLRITDTVRSYFNNYVQWKWEKSTSGPGGPWVAIPGATGTTTPFWNTTLGVYEFVSAYNIPPAQTTAANDGDLYRLVVASTPTNLGSSSCSYTDPTTITINVLPACGPPLKADLLSASGRLNNNISKISWTTSQEDEQLTFNIERSDDGINFRKIATVDGYNNYLAETNNYTYTDPVAVTRKVYYKVVMINSNNGKKYSSIIQLNPFASDGVDFGAVTNPFDNSLQYEIHTTMNGIARIELIDANGTIVKAENRQVYTGSNSLSFPNTSHLAKGMYILRAVINGNIIYRKIIKN